MTGPQRIGVRHAVACSSGTAGLHMCLHAAGIGPGDEVITSSFSFVASANAVLFTGADVVFAEVDPRTFNMDPAAVEAAITPRTKALVIVDIFGYPAEIPALIDIAERHGLAIVEDACQTIDGEFDGRKLGTWGHPAVYGFYANKQLTTAEGGVILTDDDQLAGLLKSLSNQGRSDDGAWLVHSRLGFNYRLSDVHAAIGVAQLEHLDQMQDGRARVAGWYQQRIRDIPNVAPMYDGPQRRSWFVYAPRLAPDIDRDAVITRARRTRHLGQAVSALHPPAAVLPGRVRLPAGHAAGDRGDQRIDDRAAVLSGDDRGPGGPGVRRAGDGAHPRSGSGGAVSDGARLWGGRFAGGPAEAFDR